MEDEYPEQHRADGSNAGPNRICHSYWNGLCCFSQKNGAQHIQQGESTNPSPIFRSDCQFGLPEAESKARFTKAGDDEYNPVHIISSKVPFPESIMKPLTTISFGTKGWVLMVLCG